MKSARAQRLAPFALCGATLAVAFSAVFIRFADGNAATVVWVRMSLAAAVLAPVAIRSRRRAPSAPSIRDWLMVAASGAFLAIHFLAWTASLSYTTVAASVLLVSIHPIIVTPLGWVFFDEEASPKTLAGIGLALAGTAITCAGDLRLGGNALLGDLLALAGAMALVGYLLLGRTLRAHVTTSSYSVACYAVVAILAAGASMLGGTLRNAPSPRTWVAGLLLAVVCTIGGHTVYNWTLGHLKAAVVSLAFLGEAPVAAGLALLLYGQVPSQATIGGGCLILGGIGLSLSGRVPPDVAENVL